MAAMSGASVMSSSRQRERAAGASIPFRTARPSAVSSFTDPRIWSSTWRWTPHLGVRQAQLIGPTLAPDELAGRKVVALFGRAAARDFVDVYALSRTFAKTDLLELAREVDAGFLVSVFVDMVGYLARYRDVDLALGDVDIAALRAFFWQWVEELHVGEDEE